MFFGLGNLFYGPYTVTDCKRNADLVQSRYSVSMLSLSYLKTDSWHAVCTRLPILLAQASLF